jgi:alcohol dehydrogenase
MIDEATLTPVIDKVFPFEKCREAFRYLDGGHARGKVVVAVGDGGS